MSKDYYKILGVAKGASTEEIKKAFYKLAHQHHPDKAGGDAEKFKEINAAYQVLGDAQKRQQYDQFGSAAFEQGGFGGSGFSAGGGPASGWDFSGFQGADFGDLGDIFGDMFGFGGGGRGRKQRGQDIQVDIELSFVEAAFGVEKEISLTKPSACERCGGTGGEPGVKMKKCAECDGQGIKVKMQRSILGMIQHRATCEKCHGNGEVPEKVCSTGDGTGIQNKKKVLTITIPPGVEDRAVLRVRGEGEAIKGGVSGDFFVRIYVRPDQRFEREGNDVFSHLKIGFTQAALGDSVEVETLDGKVDLRIPMGTQSGAQLRLRERGIPSGRGRGDHFVVVEVMTPTKLSKQQKSLLEELGLRE